MAVNGNGLAIVAAAGNAGKEISFANAPCTYASDDLNFFCVGATDQSYSRAELSNYGKELTTVAPGIDIRSCSSQSDQNTVRRSGTSIATPLVAGVVAVIMSWENLYDDVNTLLERVSQNAQFGILSGFDKSSGKNDGLAFLNSGIEYDNSLPYKNAPQFAVSLGETSVQPWVPNQVGLPDPGILDIISTATYSEDPSSPTSYPDDLDPDLAVSDDATQGLECATSNNWDSPQQLVSWTADFCRNLQVSTGLSLSWTYTESDGNLPVIDKALFSVTWTSENGVPTINDCQHILIDLVISGCYTGPQNWKQGGIYTTPGSVWSITPLAPRNPPELLTYGDNAGTIDVQNTGGNGVNNAPLDKGTLQQCLDGFKNPSQPSVFNTITAQCGSLIWEIGLVNWSSARDCQTACENQLSEAVNNGANVAWCNVYVNNAHCWLGFRDRV